MNRLSRGLYPIIQRKIGRMKSVATIVFITILGFNSQAQTDLQIDPSQIVILEQEVIAASGHQRIFAYGEDSVLLKCECASEYVFYEAYGFHFQQENVQLIDSMDLNDDGTKEIFLYHQWTCNKPPNDIHDQFGIGSGYANHRQYEVWDVKNNQQLLEFKNWYDYQITVSTNVIHGGEVKYDVEFDDEGTLHFEQTKRQAAGELAKGKYEFDSRSGVYQLK